MKTIKLLIADGHTIVRESVTRILGNTTDIAVAGEAASADEAMASLCRLDFDLIVMELAIGGAIRFDLIRQIRTTKPALPILILSACREDRYATDAVRAGASGYLSKECDGDLLIAVIRKVAKGGAFISARVAEKMLSNGRRTAKREPYKRLSKREREVFFMINQGHAPAAIAESLGVSGKTISTVKARIFDKLDVDNAAELFRYAVAHRLLDSPSA